MGRDTSGMAGCWRAWCATREGQKALPLAAGDPPRDGNALSEREPNDDYVDDDYGDDDGEDDDDDDRE